MKRNMTPAQAYKRVQKKAKKKKMSLSGYVESRGLSRHHIAKWKKKIKGTVHLVYAVKLGII